MKHSLKFSAFLAMLLAGFALFGPAGAAAQDDVDGLMPSDLEGIQYAVSRAYTFDFSAMMMESSPEAEMAVPSGVLTFGSMVTEFDSSDHAGASLERLVDEFATDMFGGDQEVEEVDLDLGETSRVFVQTEDLEGQEAESVLALIHDGNYVYLIFGVGAEVEMQTIVTDYAGQIVANEGSGEGEFSADGASTGGLWDKFPASDSDVLSGLLVTDEMVYPETDESEQG